MSECQVCDPPSDPAGWSVRPDYLLVADVEPPEDCLNITASPTVLPVAAPTKIPTAKPVVSTTSTSDQMDKGDIEDLASNGVGMGPSSSANGASRLAVGTVTGILTGHIIAMLFV